MRHAFPRAPGSDPGSADAGAEAPQSKRMTALLSTMAAVLLCGLTLATKPLRCDSSPEDKPRRTLRVRVVEADDRDRGVANARVNVWRITRVPPGGAKAPSDVLSDGRATADARGRATIARITRNAAYVQVTAPGFRMARRTIAAADAAEAELEVALTRGAVVGGVVRGADGSPAVGVLVRGTQPEQWGWDPAEVRTDGRGAFRLSGFHPGYVSLRAALRDGDVVWVGELGVEAGSVDADIRLSAEPTRRRLRVLVKGADGRRVPSARWEAVGGRWAPGGGARSRGKVENGVFVLPPDPDVQWVTVIDPRDKDHRALPWAPAVVGPLGARGGDLEVIMPRGVAVSGTVRDESGKPLSDVLVFARPLVTREGAEEVVLGAWSDAVSDVSGRFRIDGVAPGRVEIDPNKGGWIATPARVTVPSGPIDVVLRPLRRLRVRVRHEDGTPAPRAVIYGLGCDARAKGWSRMSVNQDGKGHFWMSVLGTGEPIRLRAGLAPTGVEDMAASEVTLEAKPGPGTILLTVPRSRSLVIRIPDWPASVPGAVRLANGPYSPGHSAWIVDGAASFEGIDPRAPLAVHAGPLPDGRIAYSPRISQASEEVTLALVPSRTIRGRAHGFPSDAQPDRVWADTSAFEARGLVGPDGTFVIRGVPPGACRVCVLFRRGQDVWAGSVRDGGSTERVDVELRQMAAADLPAWIYPRPPP